MSSPQRIAFFTMIVAGLLSAGTAAMGKTVVTDGGLDKGKFVNTTENYMELPNGSTVIKGWTVATRAGDIVWAKSPTGDGFNCARGKYCVDLTGFGNNAANGSEPNKPSQAGRDLYVQHGLLYPE